MKVFGRAAAAAPVAPTAPAENPTVARVRQILAENREMTGDEVAAVNNALFYLHQDGDFEAETLIQSLSRQISRGAIERRDRAFVASIAAQQAGEKAAAAARAERWRSLHPAVRALHLLAEDFETLRRPLEKLIALVTSDTAIVAPPESFEPLRR